MTAKKVHDIIIIGGGPAGMSAAIYAGRAGLSVVIIERGAYGGTAFQTSEIANYPGGIPGETGAEFSARLEAHMNQFNVIKVQGSLSHVDLLGDEKEVVVSGRTLHGRTVIIATGSTPNKLGVPGEEKYMGLGVSYCAVCDGPFFSGLDVFVVGGGDSAVEESLYLSRFCRKVTIIHRRDTFRAVHSIMEKAEQTANISFLLDTIVTSIGGGDVLTRIDTKNLITGETATHEAAEGENFGLFIFAGMKPQTEIFGNVLDTEDGYIITDIEMRTNIPGVFAAGDVRLKRFRQIVTATSDGAVAATRAEKYIVEGV